MATPPTTEETMMLLSSHDHNLTVLAPLLRNHRPNCQEPITLHTPLHKAILGAAQYPSIQDPSHRQEKLQQAEQTVRMLLENGAIWNDLDKEGLTPGCLADKFGLEGLYDIMVDAGVRAELLFSRLDGYFKLGEEDEDEEEEEEGMEMEVEVEGEGEGDGEEEVPTLVPADSVNGHGEQQTESEKGKEKEEDQETEQSQSQSRNQEPLPEWKDPTPVTSPAYLSSRLTYQSNKLLDSSNNGVMMSWETPIMKRTVELLLPPRPSSSSTTASSPPTGPRILNIGFGMGIIDTLFQAHNPPPSKHTIIEAHPDVLASHPLLSPTSPTSWRHNPNIEILAGKWQDLLPTLVSRGDLYDAIYFDTFAEDYSCLREFFTEYVIALLDPDTNGKFGFFNGLGADRKISYDVYRKVVEMDLFEAGLETKWEVVKVEDLVEKGEWDGVRRKYWCLEDYWLPICSFLGELEEQEGGV